MKKKVKKIPKYAEGTVPFYKNIDFYSQTGDFITQQFDNVQQSKEGVTAGGIAKGTLTGAATGAAIGSIIPGIGTAVGAIAGGAIGGITSAIGSGASYDGKSSSTDFNQIYQKGSGIASWFDDEAGAIRGATMVQNANIAKQQTQMLRSKYSMNPNNPVNPIVNAAEGGIMRKPVDALVSKGELIYNPQTKKLSKIPGSNGKPNKKDDVAVTLQEGDMVISNSPTMKMANGKTPAQNLEGLVDSNKNIKAKEAIIKKVVNWQEANKTKPQEYAKYDTGTSYVQLGKDPIQKLRQELLKPQTPEITGKDPLKNLTKDQRAVLREAIKIQNGKSKTDWLSGLSDFVPMLSAFTKDYSYHTEPTYINPVQFMPVNVSTDPIRRATDEGMAIARYNQMNANPSTGAGMAHGLQAAVNRSKSLSDAYKWQQDTQNKLIAQNAGIYNDWASREAQARHTAATETAQNEAAARLMRDQAIKDAYEFQTGRRNDKWKLSMLKPMFEYAVDDKIWKNFKIA